jgi:hypothetical protein
LKIWAGCGSCEAFVSVSGWLDEEVGISERKRNINKWTPGLSKKKFVWVQP